MCASCIEQMSATLPLTFYLKMGCKLVQPFLPSKNAEESGEAQTEKCSDFSYRCQKKTMQDMAGWGVNSWRIVARHCHDGIVAWKAPEENLL